MKKYLSAILIFDVLLPLILLGIPGFILLFAFGNFQNFAGSKLAEFGEHEARIRQTATLQRELQGVQDKVPLLTNALSNKDIEARLDRSIQTALEKRPADEIDQTLHEFQYGASPIGEIMGEGHRLSLKFSSRWEPLNGAALQWEMNFPNIILESYSFRKIPGSKLVAPSIDSTFSYFVVTEN
jgi:hypothetical protein